MPPIYRNKLSCVCNATLGSARLTLPLYNPFSLHSPLRFLSHPPSSQPLHSIPLPETNFVFEARHCSHRSRHHHHHRVQISAAVFLLLLSQTIVALQLPLAPSLAACLLPPQVKRHLPSDGLDVLLVCRIGRNNGAMEAIKREAAGKGEGAENFSLSLLSCSTVVAGCESNKVGRTNINMEGMEYLEDVRTISLPICKTRTDNHPQSIHRFCACVVINA